MWSFLGAAGSSGGGGGKGFQSFPGSAFLESTLCGSVQDVHDDGNSTVNGDGGSKTRGVRADQQQIWNKVEALCGTTSHDEQDLHSMDGSDVSNLQLDEEDNDPRDYRDMDDSSSDNRSTDESNEKLSHTDGATTDSSVSHDNGSRTTNTKLNPTSALFARALVNEVTDNPKTMTPAAMAEREKKLLKAQEAAKKAKNDKSGPKPVGVPGGVGQPNLLGSIANAITGGGAVGSGNHSAEENGERSSVLPPNSMQQNRAQVDSNGNEQDPTRDTGIVSGKHTVTIGLSLSRRHSTVGHPDTVTRQTAFDFNELQDRQYKYVSSTDSTGWRAGGGERGGAQNSAGNSVATAAASAYGGSTGDDDVILDEFGVSKPAVATAGNGPASTSTPPANSHHKVAAPDTVHIPIIHIDADSTQTVDAIINALARGEIFIPHMAVLPEALSVNGISPPDLVVRFGCERNDDLPPDDWPNWCLEFMHNQLYEYFYTAGARWMKRPFSITLARKVRWKTVKHMNRYFAHAERVIDAWREKGPQYLDPQLSYIEGGATPEEVARPHGIYLLRNGIPTNYFAPNFDPPYTTKMTRSLLLNVLGKSWEKKRREWTSEPIPRLVTPSVLMATMCGCTDASTGGFMANEVTETSFNLNANKSTSIAEHHFVSTTPPRNKKNKKNKKKDINDFDAPDQQVQHEQQQIEQDQSSSNDDFDDERLATTPPTLTPRGRNCLRESNTNATSGSPLHSSNSPSAPNTQNSKQSTYQKGNSGLEVEASDSVSPSTSIVSPTTAAQNHHNVIPQEEKKTDDEEIKQQYDSAQSSSPRGVSRGRPMSQNSTGDMMGNNPSNMPSPRMNTMQNHHHRGPTAGNGIDGLRSDIQDIINDHAAPSEFESSVAASHTTVMHKNLSSTRFQGRNHPSTSPRHHLQQQHQHHLMQQQHHLMQQQHQVAQSGVVSPVLSPASSGSHSHSPRHLSNNRMMMAKDTISPRNASPQSAQRQNTFQEPPGRQANSVSPNHQNYSPNPGSVNHHNMRVATGVSPSSAKSNNPLSPVKCLSPSNGCVTSSDSGVSLEYSVDSSSYIHDGGSTITGGASTVGGSTLIGQHYATDGSLIEGNTTFVSSNSSVLQSQYQHLQNQQYQMQQQQQQHQYRRKVVASPGKSVGEDEEGSACNSGAFSSTHGDSTVSTSEPVPTDEELFVVGWAKALDPNSGNYYYFTLDRTKTVWENPLSAKSVVSGGLSSLGSLSTAARTQNSGWMQQQQHQQHHQQLQQH